MEKITEEYIVDKIINFMESKPNGNWHPEKTKKSNLHEHGVDIKLVGGKRNSEYFFIECKGKSYAKTAKAVNKEGWLNALGQIVTRINTRLYTDKGINRAYKYGLGLYWVSAQVALRRIPKTAAQALNLHIFSVDDNGHVEYFTPSKFGKKYPEGAFHNQE